MIEERPSYDTTQFIADVGGSLGFLLGLSVLGLIGILEHVSRDGELWRRTTPNPLHFSPQLTLFFCGDCIKRLQLKNEKKTRSECAEDGESQVSDETYDVNSIYIVKKEKMDKF